jgi:hypothetical protein
VDTPKPAQTRILPLLEDLPPESLTVVEQFVRFVHEMAQEGRTLEMVPSAGGHAPYLYPTVPVPAFVFARLSGIMPPVGGDALADTEALYGDA